MVQNKMVCFIIDDTLSSTNRSLRSDMVGRRGYTLQTWKKGPRRRIGAEKPGLGRYQKQMSKFCVQAEISAELTPPCMIPSCVLGLSPQIDDKFCGSKGGILPPKSGQSPQISSVHLVHSGCASLWAYTHQREISVLNSDQKPKSSFPISSLES